jgi:hypothetical protein
MARAIIFEIFSASGTNAAGSFWFKVRSIVLCRCGHMDEGANPGQSNRVPMPIWQSRTTDWLDRDTTCQKPRCREVRTAWHHAAGAILLPVVFEQLKSQLERRSKPDISSPHPPLTFPYPKTSRKNHKILDAAFSSTD